MSDYPYVWRWRTRVDPFAPPGAPRIAHPFANRVGERLRVIARGTMNTALVEFQSDGLRATVSRNALRKADH